MARVPLRSNGRDGTAPSKKRKVTARKEDKSASRNRRRTSQEDSKAGALAFLFEAPTEIVVDILSLLKPLDLLHLSVVNKELRVFLTSPSAKIIWLSARRNVGLPDELPPDFMETAYARFLFVPTCELCDGPAKGMNEMVYLRVRLCRTCRDAKNHTSRSCNAQEAYDKVGTFGGSLALLPGLDVHTRPDSGRLPSKRDRYVSFHIDALGKKLRSLRRTASKRQFMTERETLIQRVRETREPLLEWIKQTRQETRDERDELMERRVDAICTHLLELGHSERDVCAIEFVAHPVIRKAELFNDQVWNANRAKFERILQETKAEREQEERQVQNESVLREIFTELWEALPTDEERWTFLPVHDFLSLPSVLNISRNTVDIDNVRGAFQSHREIILEEVARFHEEMRTQLVHLLWTEAIHQGISETEIRAATDEDRVRLLRKAVNGFVVAPMFGDERILNYHTMFKDGFFVNDGDDPHGDFHHPHIIWPWSQLLRCIQGIPFVMSLIIEDAGLDEETATFDELDAANPEWREQLLDVEMGFL
ncbi:hypothetical protein DACRYDRAFT_102771 [Dacryopinax primogenitus]|uniref:F-box domain-containing protein n=1 Tax=Dacryopinax primogenitus (strain DJM 731) TaxID=1858805 RepID=M5FP11_DACPD|nr:uncharacterized protein DACRYDRAFT_102771 [Dacryopinax primogenitus]EJT96698.1 hypothetical protein DACRYDRAFT_102771 [Dacryopinax primogenitus]